MDELQSDVASFKHAMADLAESNSKLHEDNNKLMDTIKKLEADNRNKEEVIKCLTDKLEDMSSRHPTLDHPQRTESRVGEGATQQQHPTSSSDEPNSKSSSNNTPIPASSVCVYGLMQGLEAQSSLTKGLASIMRIAGIECKQNFATFNTVKKQGEVTFGGKLTLETQGQMYAILSKRFQIWKETGLTVQEDLPLPLRQKRRERLPAYKRLRESLPAGSYVTMRGAEIFINSTRKMSEDNVIVEWGEWARFNDYKRFEKPMAGWQEKEGSRSSMDVGRASA
jgi:hypothetical protein